MNETNKKADLIPLGKRIRDLRLSSDLTQESLAERAGIDRTYLGGVERGERNIAFLNLTLIAEAFGISLSELLKEI
jgi:transcriptional regulator with XRE-family HTH domain